MLQKKHLSTALQTHLQALYVVLQLTITSLLFVIEVFLPADTG